MIEREPNRGEDVMSPMFSLYPRPFLGANGENGFEPVIREEGSMWHRTLVVTSSRASVIGRRVGGSQGVLWPSRVAPGQAVPGRRASAGNGPAPFVDTMLYIAQTIAERVLPKEFPPSPGCNTISTMGGTRAYSSGSIFELLLQAARGLWPRTQPLCRGSSTAYQDRQLSCRRDGDEVLLPRACSECEDKNRAAGPNSAPRPGPPRSECRERARYLAW